MGSCRPKWRVHNATTLIDGFLVHNSVKTYWRKLCHVTDIEHDFCPEMIDLGQHACLSLE